MLGRTRFFEEREARWLFTMNGAISIAGATGSDNGWTTELRTIVMVEKIGFVILSHNLPDQLLRLVRRLQRLYDNPPIAIHHDFNQCPIDTAMFPSGIKFVIPSLKTRWGQWPVVEGCLRALQILYEHSSPEWFFLLSGVDYPIAPAHTVRTGLASCGVDALIDYREVVNIGDGSEISPPENATLVHLTSRFRAELAYRLYVGLNLWMPLIRKGPRIGRKTWRFRVRDWRGPFDPTFKCYWGDFWFGANAKAANVLCNPTTKHLRLQRYLHLRTNPEECYFQTVLANDVGIKLSSATRRYVCWYGADHPKILGVDDLPAIASSGAYFARKFAPGTRVLDELDRMTDQSVQHQLDLPAQRKV